MARPDRVLGQIAFPPGAAAAEPDGSYVLGEFKPENGQPLPIAVKLEKSELAPSTPADQGTVASAVTENGVRPPANVTGHSVTVGTFGLIVLFIFGAGTAVLVALLRRRSAAAKILAVLCGVGLVLFLLAVGAVVVWFRHSRAVQQQAIAAEAEAREQKIALAQRGVSATPVQRTFPLRHKLGSDLVEELQRVIVAERLGYSAKHSEDNQSILIFAPPAVLTRVQTFLTVTDWPDPFQGLNGPTYLTDTVLRTAPLCVPCLRGGSFGGDPVRFAFASCARGVERCGKNHGIPELHDGWHSRPGLGEGVARRLAGQAAGAPAVHAGMESVSTQAPHGGSGHRPRLRREAFLLGFLRRRARGVLPDHHRTGPHGTLRVPARIHSSSVNCRRGGRRERLRPMPPPRIPIS